MKPAGGAVRPCRRKLQGHGGLSLKAVVALQPQQSGAGIKQPSRAGGLNAIHPVGQLKIYGGQLGGGNKGAGRVCQWQQRI